VKGTAEKLFRRFNEKENMDKVKDFFKKVWTGIVGWFKRWDKAKTALSVGLALVLVGGFLAAAIQTAGFKVQVYAKTIKTGEFYTYTETGEEMWNTADIYRPKSASAENPAPLVLVAPGIQRTKETQASFCIELVRRGFGVICLDPYSQGESSTTYTKQSATNEGYGLFHWMDYLHTEKGMEEFDWVDYTRIGATGHSAGGNGVQKLAEREGVLAKDKGGESRLKAAYITGYIREWNWTTANCNIGISYSAKDEGAFQNETAKKKAE
jgi:dienelactone hydrolase